MNPFLTKELNRLVELLTVTDPRTHEYLILLQSIECLAGSEENITAIVNAARVSADETPTNLVSIACDYAGDGGEEGTEEEPGAGTIYKLEEVRAALATAKREGIVISDILSAVGAKNFSAVPEDKYPAVMALLEEAKELS